MLQGCNHAVQLIVQRQLVIGHELGGVGKLYSMELLFTVYILRTRQSESSKQMLDCGLEHVEASCPPA